MDPAISSAQYQVESLMRSFWDEEPDAMRSAEYQVAKEKFANPAIGAALGALLAGTASRAAKSHGMRNLITQLSHGNELPVAGKGVNRLMGLRNMNLNRLGGQALRMENSMHAAGRAPSEINQYMTSLLAPEMSKATGGGALAGAAGGYAAGKLFNLAKQQQKQQKLMAYGAPALAGLLGVGLAKD